MILPAPPTTMAANRLIEWWKAIVSGEVYWTTNM